MTEGLSMYNEESRGSAKSLVHGTDEKHRKEIRVLKIKIFEETKHEKKVVTLLLVATMSRIYGCRMRIKFQL